jgi:AcrR family transcriptional regulator
MADIELSRRERKKGETRERIFQAACKLFRHKGFESTTIDDIAEKADVAKGTFFNYFPRKEAVLGFLSELRLEQAEQTAEEILAAAPPVAPRIMEMFVEFAAFYEEDPALARHIVEEVGRRFHDIGDEVCQRWDRLGERLIRHLQSIGEIRSDVTPARAHDILAAVYHDALMRWALPDEKPFPLQQELRDRLNIAFEGLAAHRKGSS